MPKQTPMSERANANRALAEFAKRTGRRIEEARRYLRELERTIADTDAHLVEIERFAAENERFLRGDGKRAS